MPYHRSQNKAVALHCAMPSITLSQEYEVGHPSAQPNR